MNDAEHDPWGSKAVEVSPSTPLEAAWREHDDAMSSVDQISEVLVGRLQPLLRPDEPVDVDGGLTAAQDRASDEVERIRKAAVWARMLEARLRRAVQRLDV